MARRIIVSVGLSLLVLGGAQGAHAAERKAPSRTTSRRPAGDGLVVLGLPGGYRAAVIMDLPA